jgi:hypothetical protein
MSEKTYRKLSKLADDLCSRLGRPVSIDEVIDFVLKQIEKKRTGAEFAGAWSFMSDREEAQIFESLEEFWTNWKHPRE